MSASYRQVPPQTMRLWSVCGLFMVCGTLRAGATTVQGNLPIMAHEVLPITIEEMQAALDDAEPRTPDEVSITLDGRRLDSKEAVLEWWAEVEADIAAGRHVDLGAEAR
jgi:hypothetical protein